LLATYRVLAYNKLNSLIKPVAKTPMTDIHREKTTIEHWQNNEQENLDYIMNVLQHV